MPHLELKYTAEKNDFEPSSVLSGLFDITRDSGLFGPGDIKVRSTAFEQCLVGGEQDTFAHLDMCILAGRPKEQLTALGEALFAFLRAKLNYTDNITLEVREMDTMLYFK